MDELLEKLCNGAYSPVDEVMNLLDENDYSKAVKVVEKYLECDENTAKIILMDFKTKVYDDLCSPDPTLTPQEIAHNNQVAADWFNKPKCPICGSTNLSKISMMKKATKIAAFGIFGMGDNGKTWKCNNCGSKF